jgi:hypothetical protein
MSILRCSSSSHYQLPLSARRKRPHDRRAAENCDEFRPPHRGSRAYSDLGQHGLSLDRDLLLPDFANPSKRVWPPYEVPWGMQYCENLLAALQRQPPPGSSEEYELRPRRQREQADQLKIHHERQEKEREAREQEARARAGR